MIRIQLTWIKCSVTLLALLTLGTMARATSPVVNAQAPSGIELDVFGASGQILYEWWKDTDSVEVQSLINNVNFPENPTDIAILNSFESPSDFADNFGARMRGYLYPPVTGEYIFWIASDEMSQLWLSKDASPTHATRIANVPGQTDPQEWDKYPDQESMSIFLEAGKRYYIEALHKDGSGPDHLAVAWQMPDEDKITLIDGATLSPYTRRINNRALNGTATQSSTRELGPNYEARNAIDNNTDGINTNNSITHTNEDLEAWWEVDLGQSYYLDSVRLWNRTDCCGERLSDFYLLVSEEPFASQELQPTISQSGVRAYYFEGEAQIYENLMTRANGQFVRIQLSGTNFLSLAEVQILGTPLTQAQCGSTFQEAEDGRFSGDFEVGTDAAASNGFYVHVPESSPKDFVGTLSEDFMQYCVLIETAGLYQINTRIFADGGASNSFHVTVDDEPAGGFVWDILPDNGTYAEDYVAVRDGADPFVTSLDLGEHFLEFHLREDGTRLDWLEFELVNAQPIVNNPGDQNNFINDVVSLQIVANDAEGDTLSYSAANLPSGLSINNSTGEISGTVDIVGTSDVTITVDDGISGEVTIEFRWTVTDLPNNNPTVENPGNQTGTEGDPVSLKISASDPDGDILAFSASGLPNGLSINETTGLISGTLTQDGTFQVTVEVDDGRGGTDSVSFEWVVNPSPNSPPNVTNPGAQADDLGDDILLVIEATDDDGDQLTFSAEGLPVGLSIDEDSGEISGTLTTKGTYPVSVTVNDGTVDVTINFTWVVSDPDDPQEIFLTYLPTVSHSIRVDEPNDACTDAFPININQTIQFLHEDMEDWYSFTLGSTKNVQVNLTGFTAPGQIIVYGGSCGNLTFLQNNGNFEPTKIVPMGNLAAGTYYIRVITESGYGDLTPYSLRVIGN